MGTDPQLPGRADVPSGTEPSLPYRMSEAARQAFARMRRERDQDLPSLQLDFLEDRVREWSDDALVEELRAMPTLPTWFDAPPGRDIDEVWDWFFLFTALATVAGERRLSLAVPLLLEKVCEDDPGEMFRVSLPRALGSCAGGDYEFLVRCCADAILSGRPGATYWALHGLYEVPKDVAPGLAPLLQPAVDQSMVLFPDFAVYVLQWFGLVCVTDEDL